MSNNWWRSFAAVGVLLSSVLVVARTTTNVDRDEPCSTLKQMSEPQTLGSSERAELLKVREGVWRAWFSGDETSLRKVLPPETIVSGDASGWITRDSTIKSSLDFAKSGGRLTKLEFPSTDIQSYGATAILYATYSYEIESGGKRSAEKGTALEVFVRRPEGWVHTGWQLRADPGVRQGS
jgi:hypothetical protein